MHAQVADNNKNGNALLHVAADIINLIDAPKRTFSTVWVNTSELDGSVGYGLLWSMEGALKLEKDPKRWSTRSFLFALPSVSFLTFETRQSIAQSGGYEAIR